MKKWRHITQFLQHPVQYNVIKADLNASFHADLPTSPVYQPPRIQLHDY